MSTVVFGYVVTRGASPATLDLPLVSESTVTVGVDVDPPEWREIQVGDAAPITVLGTVRVFLDVDDDASHGWASWWVQHVRAIESPQFPWPDPGYRFFKVSFAWPSGAAVIQRLDSNPSHEPEPTDFSYVQAYAPLVIDELTIDDLEAL